MTESTPTPTPEKQNPPVTPDSTEPGSNPADATGFFNRVRRDLNSEEESVHPSESAEIVVMGDGEE
jgi:hypothetical protein